MSVSKLIGRSLIPALSLVIFTPVYAQVADIPALVPPAASEQKKTTAMRVRNVRAGIMAYWIDPQNNIVPREFNSPVTFREGEMEAPPKPQKKLPPGVERVTAIDPQNSLLILGTPAGIEEVRTLVEGLDKPLTQYEVETQFLQVKRDEVPMLFGDAVNRNAENMSAVVLDRTQFEKKINTSPAQGTPNLSFLRLILIKDVIFTSELPIMPAIILSGGPAIGGRGTPNANLAIPKGTLMVKVAERETGGFFVTLELGQRETQKPALKKPVQALSLSTRIHFEWNAKDGDTMALVNLPASLVTTGKEDRVPTMIVTVRKVHRYGDDDAVIGAD